jgi:pyruvate kinase
VGAKMIIGMTKSGYTGFMVSSYRPKADIIIFSSDTNLLKALNMVWGIRGFYYDKFTTTDDTIQDVNDILKDAHLLQSGDIVINTGSMPLQERKKTNMLKVTVVK